MRRPCAYAIPGKAAAPSLYVKGGGSSEVDPRTIRESSRPGGVKLM
jgi:hypothetical protein